MNITIRSFASSEEFLEVWARGMNPDLLFLDIQFKFEMDGMELAKQVMQQTITFPLYLSQIRMLISGTATSLVLSATLASQSAMKK